WIGKGTEVCYAHMILGQRQTVTHCDGAVVTFASESDVSQIFDTSAKHKGCSYEQYFRIDGRMTLRVAVDCLRAWFPVQELADEHFSAVKHGPTLLTPIWPAPSDRATPCSAERSWGWGSAGEASRPRECRTGRSRPRRAAERPRRRARAGTASLQAL